MSYVTIDGVTGLHESFSLTFRANESNDRKTEEEKRKKRLHFALLNFFFNKMNRLFGRPKPKEPSPSITDCIAGVNIHIISTP